MTTAQKERVLEAMEKNKVGGWLTKPDGVIEIFEDVSKALEERIDRRIEEKINQFADKLYLRDKTLFQDVNKAKFPEREKEPKKFDPTKYHTVPPPCKFGCGLTITHGEGGYYWANPKCPEHSESTKEDKEPEKLKWYEGGQSYGFRREWVEWAENQLKQKDREIEELMRDLKLSHNAQRDLLTLKEDNHDEIERLKKAMEPIDVKRYPNISEIVKANGYRIIKEPNPITE